HLNNMTKSRKHSKRYSLNLQGRESFGSILEWSPISTASQSSGQSGAARSKLQSINESKTCGTVWSMFVILALSHGQTLLALTHPTFHHQGKNIRLSNLPYAVTAS